MHKHTHTFAGNGKPIIFYDSLQNLLVFQSIFFFILEAGWLLWFVFLEILGFVESQNFWCQYMLGVCFFSFSSLPYLPSWDHDRLNHGTGTSVNSCSGISLENEDIFRCDHFPLSLIVKKVSTGLFRSPPCFQSTSLPKQISTFFSLYLCLFSPSLVLSGSINHVCERRALSWGNFLGVEWVIH